MHDTKKGKYTDEENELIIDALNNGLKEGRNEREILRELSQRLNRGYSGIMSYVRKLRSEYPDRFYYSNNYEKRRLNSWEKSEEELVIKVVNEFSQRGEPLSSAIAELGQRLSRTQGAIYQRIYSLRRRYPERFHYLPTKRSRQKHHLSNWNGKQPTIRPLDELPTAETSQQDHADPKQPDYLRKSEVPTPISSSLDEFLNEEERLVYQAFEKKYGRPDQQSKKKFIQLMRTYGCTQVSISLFTLTDDKLFPNLIIGFLEERLQNNKFL